MRLRHLTYNHMPLLFHVYSLHLVCRLELLLAHAVFTGMLFANRNPPAFHISPTKPIFVAPTHQAPTYPHAQSAGLYINEANMFPSH